MILDKLKGYLDFHNVKYTVITHSPAYTAQEIAISAHLPEKKLAKTVMVKADGKMMMAVVPATDMVDLKSVKTLLGSATVELAGEEEFKTMFGTCELGAMPPFGNLYNLEVLAGDDLAQDAEIAFNAGSHRELVKMAYADFERLVRPKLGRIGTKRRVRDEEWDYGG